MKCEYRSRQQPVQSMV